MHPLLFTLLFLLHLGGFHSLDHRIGVSIGQWGMQKGRMGWWGRMLKVPSLVWMLWIYSPKSCAEDMDHSLVRSNESRQHPEGITPLECCYCRKWLPYKNSGVHSPLISVFFFCPSAFHHRWSSKTIARCQCLGLGPSVSRTVRENKKNLIINHAVSSILVSKTLRKVPWHSPYSPLTAHSLLAKFFGDSYLLGGIPGLVLNQQLTLCVTVQCHLYGNWD